MRPKGGRPAHASLDGRQSSSPLFAHATQKKTERSKREAAYLDPQPPVDDVAACTSSWKSNAKRTKKRKEKMNVLFYLEFVCFLFFFFSGLRRGYLGVFDINLL
jgi:hypothetical protein